MYPLTSVCRLYRLWNIRRPEPHHMYIFPIPCRHATLCNPRALHLKNQFAESIASSTLLPINRRSLSETVRRGFIHRSDQSFSPQRFFSSISKHGLELTDPDTLRTYLNSDLSPAHSPSAKSMLELQYVSLSLSLCLFHSQTSALLIYLCRQTGIARKLEATCFTEDKR